MSVDSGVIRAEPHVRIGSLIERDVELILERWAHRAVAEQPQARRVHHQALIDHFHDFLIALGRSLAESDDDFTSQHCLPATIHGEQRWETGWSLPELVRDYAILRLVILDYLEEVLDAPPSHRAVMAIGLAFDEAIAASVTMYVNSRDNHQQEVSRERADHERRLRAHLRDTAETLKEVDRRKNEFLAILGHEMRNPLAPLAHVVSLLDASGTDGQVLPHIRDITKRQVDQLARLADDLLDIAKIAQGQIDLRKRPVNLAAVVERAVQMSMPQIEARHHRFETAVTDEPLWMDGDDARLVQIISNLLNNAAKYTEHYGRISLAVERHGNEAVIRVRDSGVGIPVAMLPHIFDLFTQGEWSPDDSRRGMGIGLALVHRLVEMHGGGISAKSAGLGQGSEFEVRLPLSPTPPEKPATGPLPAQTQSDTTTRHAAPRRVLIVDDNADAAHMLGMLLTIQRHDVRIAHDGPTALDLATHFHPEVVLLDLGLPYMDGFEVLGRMRDQQRGENVSFIAVTGHAYDDDRQKTAAAGFDAHLVKPVDIHHLQAVLRDLASA